jgi:RelE toxin of RelE / RelB toxin-antitoxin system
MVEAPGGGGNANLSPIVPNLPTTPFARAVVEPPGAPASGQAAPLSMLSEALELWGAEPDGGIRKVRHAAQGRGESGGVRAIYYWIKDRHPIHMLVVYPKSRKDDLSDKETAILRELVKEL